MVQKISIKKVKKKKIERKKKISKNKNVEISVIRKFNKEAPEEMHFSLNDGRKIKTIFELIDMLDNIDDNIFTHHVSKDKNDFAEWIKHVFGFHELSEQIRDLSSRIETQNSLLKHLSHKLKEEK